MSVFEDRSRHFTLSAVVAHPDGIYKEFSYTIPIHIKKEIAVPGSYSSWDSILCSEGESRAFTEYSSEERKHIWVNNFKRIAEYLKGVISVDD